ncbi:cobaltochelatase subunit CobN [compost metagenome]
MDADTREFIRQHNPEALRDIAERLVEAQQRGLWENPGDYREAIENLLLDSEER